MFLRRFDLEHTLRMMKQTLGWTRPKIRTPESADRWTWLVIAAHTQLRLARPLAEDLRRPWERPAEPGRLTPARVRRAFRNLRVDLPCPARAPKPNRPGPGRPLGSKNKRKQCADLPGEGAHVDRAARVDGPDGAAQCERARVGCPGSDAFVDLLGGEVLVEVARVALAGAEAFGDEERGAVAEHLDQVGVSWCHQFTSTARLASAARANKMSSAARLSRWRQV